MKFKILSSLLVFIVTFTFSISMVLLIASKTERMSFRSKPNGNVQAKISAFLQQDLENRTTKANKLANRKSGSDPATFVAPVIDYANETEAMNLSGLPEDFQVSWLRYARATSDSAYFISHLESLPTEMTLNEEEKKLADAKFSAEEAARKALLSVAQDYGAILKD